LRSILAHLKPLIFAATVLSFAVALSYASGTDTSPTSTTPSSTTQHKPKSTHKGKKLKKTASRKRGQQKIDPQRTEQIQTALIREHYLTGTASGRWDATTEQAMQKYQADNGWQSKTTPDSRALIKLGLGPDQQHLLNPESAMTSNPPAAHTTASSPKAVAPADPSKPEN
jgi:hypothetical protein